MRRQPNTRTRVYLYIAAFWRQYGYAPQLREIAHALNLGSKETVRYHVRALRAEGKVEWTEGPSRTIRIKEAA